MKQLRIKPDLIKSQKTYRRLTFGWENFGTPGNRSLNEPLMDMDGSVLGGFASYTPAMSIINAGAVLYFPKYSEVMSLHTIPNKSLCLLESVLLLRETSLSNRLHLSAGTKRSRTVGVKDCGMKTLEGQK